MEQQFFGSGIHGRFFRQSKNLWKSAYNLWICFLMLSLFLSMFSSFFSIN